MEYEFSSYQIAKADDYDHIDDTRTVPFFVNYTDTVISDPLNSPEITEILNEFYKEITNKTNYPLVGLYVPVIPISIIANMVVIVIVYKYRYMRSTMNYFVINLSVADLLVTIICMPAAISQAVSINWFFGEIMCKIFFYLQGVTVAASVFTIMAMSIERYVAIRSPIAVCQVFDRKRISIIIATIWFTSVIIFGPLLKAVKVVRVDQHIITLFPPENSQLFSSMILEGPEISVCSEDCKSVGIDGRIFGVACFLLVYAAPGLVIIVVCSIMSRTLYARKPPFDTDSIKESTSIQQSLKLIRERKRVAWILVTLAVLFALCWLPYNVLRLCLDLEMINNDEWIADILSYFLFLGHVNSMLNPIVYCIMTKSSRRSIVRLFCQDRSNTEKCKCLYNVSFIKKNSSTTYV